MSTQVVQYNPQLPAFLRVESLFADTDKAIAGIGGGMPAYISIRGAKWHLVGADGEEAQVNQLHLDVIVLGGNEHVSKSYYSGAYDPAQGGGAVGVLGRPSAVLQSDHHIDADAVGAERRRKGHQGRSASRAATGQHQRGGTGTRAHPA